jgi:hypothetical protein
MLNRDGFIMVYASTDSSVSGVSEPMRSLKREESGPLSGGRWALGETHWNGSDYIEEILNEQGIVLFSLAITVSKTVVDAHNASIACLSPAAVAPLVAAPAPASFEIGLAVDDDLPMHVLVRS